MQLASIRGQDRVREALKRSISADRVAHAYLFEGPSGCGRRTTALALIQALFCSQPVNGDACDVCPSCRKFVSGNHPDLQLLSPLPDKRDISIEQIRELQKVLALRPFEASRKACLIEPAERVNEKAANALLKTLEEPPGAALIILLTNQADLLLPTIRSRCQHLRFNPLDEATVAGLLVQQGMEAEQAARLASLAEGSIEIAGSLDRDGDISQRRELLQMLANISTGAIASIFECAEQLAAGDRNETMVICRLLISLVRDVTMLATAGGAGVANQFLITELTTEAARFSRLTALQLPELALETAQAIQGNANFKLAFEHFLLTYDGLRKGA